MQPPVLEVAADQEIELKLTTRDPAQLAALAAVPILASAGKRRRRQLNSIYYDTQSCSLRRAGYTLRIRDDGGHFVMTVKAQRDAALARLEREETLASATLDHAVLARLLPGEMLEAIGGAPLLPLFEARIEREQVTLDFAGSTIEVALDRGEILAGDRSEPVAEVELELERGSVAGLYELALELSNHAPLVPSSRTKSDRGFAFASGSVGPEPAEDLRLSRRMSRDEALSAIFSTALAQAVDALPRVADASDPEGVHQVRVALRRVRMGLWLVKRAEGGVLADVLSEEVGWLASELGAARDWDVLATEILPVAAAAGLERDGFRKLIQRVELHREQAHERAGDAVASGRAGRLLLSLGLWASRHGWREAARQDADDLTRPVKGLARKALRGLHRKALRRGRKFDRLDAEGRHRLRIALKSLRYAADLFLPLVLLKKQARRQAATLKRLQDEFGRFNDAIRASELLGQLSDEALSPGARRAVALVLAMQEASLIDGEATLRRSWLDFTRKFEIGGKR